MSFDSSETEAPGQRRARRDLVRVRVRVRVRVGVRVRVWVKG